MKPIIASLAALAIAATFSSCNDGRSYAELLTDESHAVNYYLANNRVIGSLPENNEFEYGPDAPFYRMNEDGTLYMQVINPGNPENRAEYDQLIYFRFTRYNLNFYMATGILDGTGNATDFTLGATSFRYGNTQLTSASTYGMGIQEPLKYLGIDCEVNLIVKSQLGPSSEIASVVPYLYNLRYFPSPL